MCSRPKIKTSKLSCVLKAGAVRRQHGWRLLGGDESDVSAFTDQLKDWRMFVKCSGVDSLIRWNKWRI